MDVIDIYLVVGIALLWRWVGWHHAELNWKLVLLWLVLFLIVDWLRSALI